MGLLLLVSSLLLWEHATSMTDDQRSNEELYSKMLSVSHRTHVVARRMYRILDARFAKGRLLMNSGNNTCHTASIPTPNNTEDLLKVIINISNAWKYPLKLLTPATLTHLGSYDGMLARAVEVKFGNEEVLAEARILLSRIQPGFEENVYPEWPELRQLRSSNEETHLFAFYKLFYCLRNDSQKIEHYLKTLGCQIIKKLCASIDI
ncbi:prolactin-3C1-like [Mesocricetus auratus]|uniref:Prolactin-3C1-like n=1 Tax=Mesocricetus auratus TaxID=10036 RepID=A0A1U8BR56_MESAU|nr:prolactin-3C1-like [Mesocricetus auratus]